MNKAIYRAVTPKRRTARPKTARPKVSSRAVAPFQGMVARLNGAAAALSAARGRR